MTEPPEPEFDANLRDGILVVTVKRRAGRSDENLIRAARKQAGVLAPAHIEIPEQSQPIQVHMYTNQHQIRRPFDRGQQVCLVGRSRLDRVWTIVQIADASLEQRETWARRGAAYRDWVDRGGGLMNLDLVDQNGVEGDIRLVTRFNHRADTGIWVVPGGDHWPRCVGCREPWPCGTHDADMNDLRADRRRLRQCHRCGKTDGNQHVFKVSDGFPERRSYHLRKGACLNEAKRWATEHGWECVEYPGGRTFRRVPDKSVDT